MIKSESTRTKVKLLTRKNWVELTDPQLLHRKPEWLVRVPVMLPRAAIPTDLVLKFGSLFHCFLNVISLSLALFLPLLKHP
jgi:hypothetical protein